MKNKIIGPRVLLFDVETTPNLGYTWGKWEQNVIKFVKEWELLSFAYKWLDSSTVTCITRQTHSEKELCVVLRNLINSADVVIAHNGDQFDLKKSRTKFLQHGLKPPAVNTSVDTKKIAKGQFAFNSNSLNDLGETLGLGKKVDTGGFDLWLGCMANKPAAWAKMSRYNKQDVVLLEKVYKKLRSWAPNHPSLAALSNKIGCPVCASDRVTGNGVRATTKTLQQRWRCQDCGHSYTGGKPKNKR